MSAQDTRTHLLTENPWRLMVSLSLPAIIGMVVIGLYNFMDAVYVGNMIGSEAMTAVKVSYPFTLINSGISTLIGVGSASVLSRAVGKNDRDTVDRIMGNLSVCIIVLSLAVTVFGMIFTRQLLTLAGAKGEIMELGVRYLRIIFIGSLFVNFAQSANMVMRGEGLLKKAMMIMGLGAVLNIILDPLFLWLLKTVEGAAYATILSQFIQACITLWYFTKKSQNVRINRLKLDRRLLPEVLGVGVSAMLMQVMQLVQQTVMYSAAQKYGGSEWQTVLSAALSLQAFAFIPLWGMSQGFQPAAGTNYGAKDYVRVKTLMRVFVTGATALSLIFYLPVMLAPKAMLSLLIADNPALVNAGVSNLRIFFSSYITLGLMIMTITLFQSLGQGGKAALLTILRQIAFFIPLIFLLPKLYPADAAINGVFFAPVITDLLVLVLSLCMIASTFRKIGTSTQKKKNAGYAA